MDLNSLRYFVRVSDLGSFGKAAVSMGVTQPTISRIIGDLEAGVGTPLFHRTGRGVALTEAGETAYPRAKALLHEAEQLSADLQALGKAPTGTVSLGTLPSLMHPLAAELFEGLRTHAPGIRLKIFEGFSGQIERWVAEGHVDIGLLSRYRAARRRQDDVLLESELLLVRAASARPLPARVPFTQLARLPLVLPSPPNGLRVLLEETARRQKIELNVVLEADSLNAQKDVVKRCGCYTVLTAQAIAEERAQDQLLSSGIANPRLLRQVVVTTTQQRPLSRASREVLRAIQKIMGGSEPAL